ncbi:uncharacterized protein LOC118443784 [Vespa mandarinia]|uniref:uncharacterized protein LOC118443784 n=1 Tax=Vespa mandarinia TaxID=7446 RepID=UPI001609184E|nr:uncharacterized protein LOC118443784 [Vespa mandarinia]XP_035727145.1 uncharacterized protein LOC118443784 [Vespa mandarinia]
MSSDNINMKIEIVDYDCNQAENCNDITLLARKIREKEAFSQEDLNQLRNLKVKLIHEVPPQHKVEIRSGTHVPSREELEQFMALAPLKKGSFSPDEDDKIVHNWKKFCKLHNWSKRKYRAFLSLRDGDGKKYTCKKKETKKFAQFLANGLPNRTLYSVYHRFKILYSSHLNRRYTQEEDIMILNHIDHNPFLDEKRKFVDLAKVLNRSRASVWRRYRLLKRSKNSKMKK